MGILNYSTKIQSSKTVGEIQELLGRKGADRVAIDYDKESRRPAAVLFVITFPKGNLEFRLPCNVDGVLLAMQRDRSIAKQYKNLDQAERTAWRIIKDWVEAQMAIIEAGQATMPEIFLAYALDGNGKTAYSSFIEQKQLLLTK